MTRWLLALVVVASCKKSEPAASTEVQLFRDYVCACKDLACVEKLTDPANVKWRTRTLTDAEHAFLAEATVCAQRLAPPPIDAAAIDAPPEPPKPEVPSTLTADALLAAARAWQHAQYPGRSPYEIRAWYIEANGALDPEHGSFRVEFGFHADLSDDPRRKTGAPVKPAGPRPSSCPYAKFAAGAWEVGDVYGGCRDVTIVPKCSIETMWKRAQRRGAPADALASITFRTMTPSWQFSITDQPRNIDIDYFFEDDCKIVVEKP